MQNISSNAGMTSRSDGVLPATVAFVESESNAKTPSSPYLFQSFEIIAFADDGRFVNFVIARVDQSSERRFDRQRKTINERMRCVNIFDRKIPDLRNVVRFDAVKQNVVEHFMFIEFSFGESVREMRQINRQD